MNDEQKEEIKKMVKQNKKEVLQKIINDSAEECEKLDKQFGVSGFSLTKRLLIIDILKKLYVAEIKKLPEGDILINCMNDLMGLSKLKYKSNIVKKDVNK